MMYRLSGGAGVAAAVVYGEVRAASGTVWTAVLMHGAANVLAFAIIDQDLITFGDKVLAYIAPESVIVIILWALAGWWLLRRFGKDVSGPHAASSSTSRVTPSG